MALKTEVGLGRQVIRDEWRAAMRPLHPPLGVLFLEACGISAEILQHLLNQ